MGDAWLRYVSNEDEDWRAAVSDLLRRGNQDEWGTAQMRLVTDQCSLVQVCEQRTALRVESRFTFNPHNDIVWNRTLNLPNSTSLNFRTNQGNEWDYFACSMLPSLVGRTTWATCAPTFGRQIQLTMKGDNSSSEANQAMHANLLIWPLPTVHLRKNISR